MTKEPPVFICNATIRYYIQRVQRLPTAYRSALISYTHSFDNYKLASMNNQLHITNALHSIARVYDNLDDNVRTLKYFPEMLEIATHFTLSHHQDLMVVHVRALLALLHMGKYIDLLRTSDITLDIAK
ncbi:unnamed protein product [Adineta ricciae]|uniref:Uncharacterized protein n=1 Tax=Adineta ricciae TaxID=249248 RepID=A0A815WIH4_ADIRI|nr:unnamed protein product [Adineta ricciae]CAF1546347.1 unnamed protein product [Adineta ricciae]